jgi:hypothetical protein
MVGQPAVNANTQQGASVAVQTSKAVQFDVWTEARRLIAAYVSPIGKVLFMP